MKEEKQIGQINKIEETKNTYFVSYAVGVNTDTGDETALVIPNINKKIGNMSYFILNGNWIDEYKKCKSKQEQIQLYRDNYEKHGGFWTETLKELDEIVSN